MTVLTNETGEPIRPRWLTAFKNGYEDRLTTKPRFEQRFCGVLVGLIVAVTVVISLVAIAVSGPQ
jgi:hypothetical protein